MKVVRTAGLAWPMAKETSKLRRFLRPHRVVFLGALLLGTMCWGYWLFEGYRHRQVADVIRSEGGWVDWSHWESIPVPAAKGARFTTSRKVSTLPWYAEKTGLSMAFRRLTYVTLQDKDRDPKPALDELRTLGKLDSLSLYGVEATGPMLAEVLRDVQIRRLFIQGTPIGRGRLRWLNHESLVWLCVARTQFSNPAIDSLPISLEYFDATRTRINDEGLAKFKRLTNLKTLKLKRTPTTGAAIEQLQREMPWCGIGWEPLKQP